MKTPIYRGLENSKLLEKIEQKLWQNSHYLLTHASIQAKIAAFCIVFTESLLGIARRPPTATDNIEHQALWHQSHDWCRCIEIPDQFFFFLDSLFHSMLVPLVDSQWFEFHCPTPMYCSYHSIVALFVLWLD